MIFMFKRTIGINMERSFSGLIGVWMGNCLVAVRLCS